MKNFSLTQGFKGKRKGFQVKLPNGYVVSVQFGWGNYCLNKDEDMENPSGECDDAETAILDPNGNFVEYKGDDVQGHQGPQDFLDLIDFARKLDKVE